MEIENIECTQCGAVDFEDEKKGKIRCSYCLSLFYIKRESKKSGVIVEKGGKVIFKPSANIIIHGGLHIENEAEVELDGNITLIERGSDTDIKKAKKQLKS